MAEITVADSAGFCFGVDRAVKLCYQALKTYPKVATLGPIIHNQSVVDDLKKNGARDCERHRRAGTGRVRSHPLSRCQPQRLRPAGSVWQSLCGCHLSFRGKDPRRCGKHTKMGTLSSSPEMQSIRK